MERFWPNKFSSPCAGLGCENYVERQAGIVLLRRVGTKIYDTYCAACAKERGIVLPPAEDIGLSLYGQGYVRARAGRFLGRDKWTAFFDVASASGGQYRGQDKEFLVHRQEAEVFLESLRAANLSVHLDEGAALLLAAETNRKFLDEKIHRARVKTLVELCAERGLLLYPFQKVGVEWLRERDKALLCDEMGLGKTVQALCALPAPSRVLGIKSPAVVVVCKNMGKSTWEAETCKWRPDLRPILLEGLHSFRWPSAGEMIVLNYDILPELEEVGSPPPDVCLIADEAQAVKNRSSKRAVRFRALADLVRTAGGRTWILTGTPLMNRLGELWQLCQAAGVGQLAYGSYSHFKEICGCTSERHPCRKCKHFAKHSKERGCHKKGCDCTEQKPPEHVVWGEPSEAVAEGFRKVALRRRRIEVLPDLPRKSYQTHSIRLSEERRRAVDRELSPGWEASLAEAFATQGGAAFIEMSEARRILAEAKVGAALELVEEFVDAGEPLIVFSCHTAPLEAISKIDGFGLIDGSVPQPKRSRLVASFQAGDGIGLACNVAVASTTITLTRACHALFVDEPWNPSDSEQCEDRLARIGQERPVMIHRLVADHALDIRLAELHAHKRGLIAKAVDGGGSATGNGGSATGHGGSATGHGGSATGNREAMPGGFS
jgi:hypothetical protein